MGSESLPPSLSVSAARIAWHQWFSLNRSPDEVGKSCVICVSAAGPGARHSAGNSGHFVGQWARGSEFTECCRGRAADSSARTRQAPSGPGRVVEAASTGTKVHVL